MGFVQVAVHNLGPFGGTVKCEYCGKSLKGCAADTLEHVHYFGGNYKSMYFCRGHIEKWIKKSRREYILKQVIGE